MTFVQLEYIVAVDTFRHFALAAGHCFVTQPTLSMQIQKMEEEMGIKIFDRSKQPVVPTEAGREIIEQARKVLAERNLITEIVQHKRGILTGELRIGIIPTLAPYLLPLFVPAFNKKISACKALSYRNCGPNTSSTAFVKAASILASSLLPSRKKASRNMYCSTKNS